MLKALRSKRGEGYIDILLLVLVVMLVLALAVNVLPVFAAKNQLNHFANELIRDAEIAGRVGTETSNREIILQERTGLSPAVSWSKRGNIQLNEEVTVVVYIKVDIGLFGGFGSFPVTLTSAATGKSEVYHK